MSIQQAMLSYGGFNADAVSIYANLVSWWDFEENSAGTQFLDSHGTNHMSSRDAGGALATSSASTASGKVGRGFLPATARTPYIPRSNTALDAPNSDWSFVMWLPPISVGIAGTARFVAGRLGSSVGASQWYLALDGTTNNVIFHAFNNSAVDVPVSSVIQAGSTGDKLVACSFDRTNNLIRIRLKGGSSDANVTAAFSSALYTGASTNNFCLNGGMSADGTLFSGGRDCPVPYMDGALYRSGVTTESEFQYLYNSGSGKNYATFALEAGH